LQTELVEAGVKLSAAPATAHMLRSRFARFIAVLVATVERAVHDAAMLMPQLG
jgi:hypothetical protein